MKEIFKNIAKSTQYVRVQRNINQHTAALESGISLRTLQNIEAGKPVKSESLFYYLDYLNLLTPMISTLPNPEQLTPMEQLNATPKRRVRASMASKPLQVAHPEQPYVNNTFATNAFAWGDEK